MAVQTALFSFEEGKQGWLESWSMEASSPGVVLPKAKNLAYALVQLRSTFTTITSVRVTTKALPATRLGAHASVRYVGTRPGFSTVEGPDPAPVAAQIGCQLAAGQFRSVLWRGLADSDVIRDPTTGYPTPPQDFITGIQDFVSVLVLDNWGIAQQLSTNNYVKVLDMAADPIHTGEYTIFNQNAADVPAPGAFVHFKGFKREQLPWLKGNFLAVRQVVGQTPQFNIQLPESVQPAISGGINVQSMYFQVKGWSANPVISMGFQDYRSRKTGRPTALTRGRSRGLHYRR